MMPEMPQRADICTVTELAPDSDLIATAQAHRAGLLIIPEANSFDGSLAHSSDAGDLKKWIKEHHPEINLVWEKADSTLFLRSGDFWLPLVVLANDITIQVYLNLVASYLYDRMKGMFATRNPRVEMSAIYHDGATNKTKRFDFKGDTESFSKAVKKFDLNEFLND